MNQFLEELKSRMEDAQKRLQTAALALQAAQAHHQGIAQEFGSLQFLYQAELRKVQGNAAAPGTQTPQVTTIFRTTVGASVQPPSQDRVEINRTEIVRQLLREHPSGMTPNELWKVVSSHIAYRPYLYSILKRLKDKGDAFQRRGKYFPKVMAKQEEGKEHTMVQ